MNDFITEISEIGEFPWNYVHDPSLSANDSTQLKWREKSTWKKKYVYFIND